MAGAGTAQAAPDKTPIVLFPAFHFNKVVYHVEGQQVDPQCPSSGTFEDWYGNPNPNATFSQVCRDKLMTLQYDSTKINMKDRFSNQVGVTTTFKDYGKTASAPFYDPMFSALESAGWVKDVNIRVAGYDNRLTPDMADFLDNAKALIEDTYNDNGGKPVRLVGHSTGPIFAHYLLTHTSDSWKQKYIQGFTSIAGNLPGQGLLYSTLFAGLNLHNLQYPTSVDNAKSSSKMMISHPSSYLNAADPAVFGDSEVVLADASTGKEYTPNDLSAMMQAPGMPAHAEAVADYYTGFVKFSDSSNYPNVDVRSEIGSGLDTLVGATLSTLSTGQVLDYNNLPVYTADGDGNQEFRTNKSVNVWSNMICHTYKNSDSAGVNHMDLPSNSGVLQRLIADAESATIPCV